jgi:acyl carrier protein
MDREEVFERFKSQAVKVLEVESEQVRLDARFDNDLKADSLDLVELVMALEEEFNIDVPEDELNGVETVQQAFDLVFAKL